MAIWRILGDGASKGRARFFLKEVIAQNPNRINLER
jgi:hypothetical protein